ncbi:hypothetical protein [Nocardia sp. bgisy134]|uniref:hypothetical protein n=1 Tax=unclassified Nocardia TaxID=2637762 RepID=UPI003D72A343
MAELAAGGLADLDYDRVHNPDRPLVTGAVSTGELRAAMGVLGAPAVESGHR